MRLVEIIGTRIRDRTLLSPGEDIYKCSFDSAYFGIFPLQCEILLSSFDRSPPGRSDRIRRVSVG